MTGKACHGVGSAAQVGLAQALGPGKFMSTSARKPDSKFVGAGVAIGAGVGAALGVVFGSIAMGVAAGVAVGVVLGALLGRRSGQP